MVYEKLQEDLKKAMLAKDVLKRDCLRGVISGMTTRQKRRSRTWAR